MQAATKQAPLFHHETYNFAIDSKYDFEYDFDIFAKMVSPDEPLPALMKSASKPQ
jgi:hypothetical protein